MLIMYGDDSFDKDKRVFAAGAVAASQQEWDEFIPRWLQKNPTERPFHAADCDSDRGLFKERSHEDNKSLYASNVQLFRNSTIYGGGVSISVKDYWEVFPFAPDDKFWPYYMCFAGVLAQICWVAKKPFAFGHGDPTRVRETGAKPEIRSALAERRGAGGDRKRV